MAWLVRGVRRDGSRAPATSRLGRARDVMHSSRNHRSVVTQIRNDDPAP